jgi:hypothetical protein
MKGTVFFPDHTHPNPPPHPPHTLTPQELGILPDDGDGNGAIKGAAVMFCAFIGFGVIPLFGA